MTWSAISKMPIIGLDADQVVLEIVYTYIHILQPKLERKSSIRFMVTPLLFTIAFLMQKSIFRFSF